MALFNFLFLLAASLVSAAKYIVAPDKASAEIKEHLCKKDVTCVDIRGKRAFEQGHITNSIPYVAFDDSECTEEDEVYFVCDTGASAAHAADVKSDQYNTKSYGSVAELKAKGAPMATGMEMPAPACGKLRPEYDRDPMKQACPPGCQSCECNDNGSSGVVWWHILAGVAGGVALAALGSLVLLCVCVKSRGPLPPTTPEEEIAAAKKLAKIEKADVEASAAEMSPVAPKSPPMALEEA